MEKVVIKTDKAAKPGGWYSQAYKVGDLIYTAGITANDPVTQEMIAPGDIAGQTEQIIKNLKIILEEAGSDLEHVVKTLVFVKDIDEFAKYACQYAGKIDCSISGKSMLALYERIEIMEEDGIALTKEEAENLIEEAADRAENPSFFKKITGIFSSNYDRDGLLILKEEHFL